MDPLAMALLVGLFGVCAVWAATRALARPPSEKACQGSARESAQGCTKKLLRLFEEESTRGVYSKILRLRILGLVLCLLALAVLLTGSGSALPSVLAFALALGGCLAQYAAFRVRYRHPGQGNPVPQKDTRDREQEKPL